MLYIKQTNAFWGDIQNDKTLRAALKTFGIDARRMSRFTQLALLGALPLREQITPDTPIFLGSPFASPSKFTKMFTQLNEQDLPSPLDFMANLNNAATFQLAQSLQTQATTLFLAINGEQLFQPLQLAALENKLVLVGWAFEHSQAGQKEGSLWWLVSPEPKGNCVKIALPELTQHFADFDRTFPQRLEKLIEVV